MIGDRQQVGKPSRYVTSHPSQLSLAIPPWVGATRTGEIWDVKRHIARCTSFVFLVWQRKLMCGWGLTKRRSAPIPIMTLEGPQVYFTLRSRHTNCWCGCGRRNSRQPRRHRALAGTAGASRTDGARHRRRAADGRATANDGVRPRSTSAATDHGDLGPGAGSRSKHWRRWWRVDRRRRSAAGITNL